MSTIDLFGNESDVIVSSIFLVNSCHALRRGDHEPSYDGKRLLYTDVHSFNADEAFDHDDSRSDDDYYHFSDISVSSKVALLLPVRTWDGPPQPGSSMPSDLCISKSKWRATRTGSAKLTTTKLK